MIAIYVGIALLWSGFCAWFGYQCAIAKAYDRGFKHARRIFSTLKREGRDERGLPRDSW
jgi:hypothetical protein